MTDHTPNPEAVEAASDVLFTCPSSDPSMTREDLARELVQATEPHTRKAVLAEVQEKFEENEQRAVNNGAVVVAATWQEAIKQLDAAFPEECNCGLESQRGSLQHDQRCPKYAFPEDQGGGEDG